MVREQRGGGARGNVGAGRAQGARSFANAPSPSMSRADGGSRQSMQTAMQNRPNAQIANRPANQNLGNVLSQRNQSNGRTAAQVTSQFRQQYPNANNMLNNRLNSNYYGNNANLWRNEGWAATAGWMGLGYDNGYPAYYYDANGIPDTLTPQQAITYSPNVTVVQQPPVQTEQPVITATTPAEGEWLPLGVFAVGSNADEASYSNKVMQLSLNKQGYISGTYYNAATDKSYPVEGKVDKTSQEAIWKTSDNPESPVARTGLYNLTQDVADIQVRFPDGIDQNKVLVRLKNQ